MSSVYSITARIIQNSTNAFFPIVEQATYVGSTWTEANGEYTLTMTNSGTSGSLRFEREGTGEFFLVALGVHSYLRWCDIEPNLDSDSPGVILLPRYYDEGNLAGQREKTMSEYAVTSSSGFNYMVNYTVPTGQELKADIIIW